MTTLAEHRIRLAQQLREAAAMVESGMISECRVDCDYEYILVPDGFTKRRKPTGWETVTIVLRGNRKHMVSSVGSWPEYPPLLEEKGK